MARVVRTIQEANAEIARLEGLITKHLSGLKDLDKKVSEQQKVIDKTSPAAAAQVSMAALYAHLRDKNNPHTTSDANLSISDVVTNNVSTTAHGFAPKAPNDGTNFLDGTGAWDTVKDTDLSISDNTTNDVGIAAHGFCPKAPNDASQYLDGTGAWSTPATGLSGGTLTLDNSGGTTTTVNNANVTANSRIMLEATHANSAVAGIYVSAKNAGVSFVVTHPASPGAGATMDYIIYG